MSAFGGIVLQNWDVFANAGVVCIFAVPSFAVPMRALRHRRIGTNA
jgi:hypothetical protein